MGSKVEERDGHRAWLKGGHSCSCSCMTQDVLSQWISEMEMNPSENVIASQGTESNLVMDAL